MWKFDGQFIGFSEEEKTFRKDRVFFLLSRLGCDRAAALSVVIYCLGLKGENIFM